jgi:hypothetical protein
VQTVRSLEVHVISRVLIVVFLMAAFSLGIRPMSGQNPPLPPQHMPGDQSNAGDDEARARIEREMAKKANKERYSALKRDTDKLLELANELKTNVDKSNENTLSVDVVKKAEEIEKLAHSVKEKMKGN